MSGRETSVDLAIGLPLGAVAQQLKRAESELRFLSAKASGGAEYPGNGDPLTAVAGRLEQINETLDAIRALIADIEKGLLPKSPGAKSGRRNDRDD